MAQARGKVTIDTEECKGCGVCVDACPPKCLELLPGLNAYGVHPARYTGRSARAAASASMFARSRGRLRYTGWSSRKWRSRRRRGPMRQLCKGNVAIVKGAVLAGCRAYYGYPITPASEIAESGCRYMPQVGGTFLQAESEVAAINMVYGAASAGMRVMTASSGPGMSLMQEGIRYLAGAELPCVVVDIVRGGPGLGNIAPEQSDYFAVVKGGGHGNYQQHRAGARFRAGDGGLHHAGL